MAADGHPSCVVIDPGPGAESVVATAIAERGLSVDAIVCTHGHIDHVGDAAALARRTNAPVFIHPDDEHLLTDPIKGLGLQSSAMLRQLGVETLPRPTDVRPLVDGEPVPGGGLEFIPLHAPGHTPGCMLLSVTDPADASLTVCFTGDVVFAGSIGRTDLPGGDHTTMLTSLNTIAARLDGETVLLPGHGPQTSMARELATNPYLRVRGE